MAKASAWPWIPRTLSVSRSAWPWTLRSFRARQWWYFALLPAARVDMQTLRTTPGASLGPLLFGALLAALVLAHAYGLNAWTDRGTDLDERKNPLKGQALPPSVPWLVTVPALLAVLLSWQADRTVLAAVLCSLASSAFYSAGPHWKAAPVVGTCLNAGIFAPLLLLAPWPHPPHALPTWLAVFVGLVVQNQLLHELADAQEDAHAGARTTARWLGPQRTRGVAGVLGAVTAAVAWQWAPSSHLAAMSGLVLAATTGLSLTPSVDPATRRAQHRYLSLAGGALLWLLGQG